MCLGYWLEGSEWIELISAAEIRTPGRAKAILLAGHVTHTRYVHQVNAAALYMLLHQVWEKSESDDIDTWIKTMKPSCAQFSYWYTVLELECILLFVQSIRKSNLPMFINSLEKVIPWMFALGRTNHYHWLPIYLKSLKELHLVHSSVFEEFQKGSFTVNKTNRLFSCISDDHVHEQNNKLIKSDGGVVGILDSAKVLL